MVGYLLRSCAATPTWLGGEDHLGRWGFAGRHGVAGLDGARCDTGQRRRRARDGVVVRRHAIQHLRSTPHCSRSRHT